VKWKRRRGQKGGIVIETGTAKEKKVFPGNQPGDKKKIWGRKKLEKGIFITVNVVHGRGLGGEKGHHLEGERPEKVKTQT